MNDIKSKCKKCSKEFKPLWLESLKKYSNVCGVCALGNLMDLLEEDAPDSSIKEISDNEQSTTRIRSLIEKYKKA